MNLLSEIFFPEYCVICKKLGNRICDKCKKSLEKIDFQHCIICDSPSLSGKTHIQCQNNYSPEKFLSLYNYKDVARTIILKSKYGQKSYRLLDTLINLDSCKSEINSITSIDLIVPIPMTKTLKKSADINHAFYIAKSIGKIKNLRVIDLLTKSINKSQKSMSKQDRKYKIKGQIKIDKSYIPTIQNKSILLVDDVLTTGATMIESSKILKSNGAKSVICMTLTKDQFHNV